MVWGLLSQPTRGLRTKGAIDALKKAGLKVDYLEINSATNADPTAGVPTFTAYVSSHPDVKLVVIDHGGLTATAQTYLEAAHKGPNDSRLADRPFTGDGEGDPGRLDRPRPRPAGVARAGYLPILQVCLSSVYKFAGLYIDTGSGIINKSNIGPSPTWRTSRSARGRATANGGGAEPAPPLHTEQSCRTRALTDEPLLELENISKWFGEVRALEDANLTVGAERDRRAPRRQRRGQVHPDQDRHRLSPPMGARIQVEGRAAPASHRPAGARPRHRDRLPGAGARRPAVALAQHLHGPRADDAARAARRRRDAGGDGEARGRAPALHVEGRLAGKLVGSIWGWSGIEIARALHFEAELIILDEPTMGLSVTETRRRSTSSAGSRPRARRASSSTTTSSTSTRWSTGWSSSTADAPPASSGRPTSRWPI